jgi:hypothetical protein
VSPDGAESSTPIDVVGATPRAATPAELTGAGSQATPFSDARGSPGEDLADSTPEQVTERVIWGTKINYAEAVAALDNFLTTFVLARADPPTTPSVPATAGASDGDDDGDGEAAAASGASDGEVVAPAGNAQAPLYPQLLADLHDTGGSALDVNLAHLRSAHEQWYKALVSYPENLVPVFDQVANDVFARSYPDAAEAIAARQREAMFAATTSTKLSACAPSIRPTSRPWSPFAAWSFVLPCSFQTYKRPCTAAQSALFTRRPRSRMVALTSLVTVRLVDPEIRSLSSILAPSLLTGR